MITVEFKDFEDMLSFAKKLTENQAGTHTFCCTGATGE